MTYIAPQSDIVILRGIPFSNDYQHTWYFANKDAQEAYFNSTSLKAYTLSNYSYQRVDRNKLRVSVPVENLYNCNYMYFTNNGFEQAYSNAKRFYCFITSVEYINNGTSEITYEVDEIQTWFYNCTLRQCLVVRQHSENDAIYSQCEPEEIQVSAEYSAWDKINEDNGIAYILITAGHWVEYSGDIGNGYLEPPSALTEISNVRCPVEVSIHTPSGSGDYGMVAMMTKIKNLVKNGREDAVLGVYCVPSLFGNDVYSGVLRVDEGYGGNKEAIISNSFQGYTPRNNKLYNYPFCQFEAQTPSTKQVFAMEDFRSGRGTTQQDSVNFYLYVIQAPVPQLYLVPRNYQGQDICWEKALLLDNFLQVPYMGDSFEMWAAQNTGSLMTGLAASMAQLAITAFTPDPVGAAIGIRGLIGTVGDAVGQFIDATQRPNNVYGLGGGVGLTNIYQNIFRLEYKTIDYWQAHQIDSYFTKYGYKQNVIKMPNIHARQKWTYVQTDGCSLLGNIPSDSASFIKSRFDKGITFWSPSATLGDYNQTNPTL